MAGCVLDEISAGQAMDLAAVGRLFPGTRGNDAVSTSTVHKWTVRGIKVPNGPRVCLESARIGGRVLTSRAAVQRFISKLTAHGRKRKPKK